MRVDCVEVDGALTAEGPRRAHRERLTESHEAGAEAGPRCTANLTEERTKLFTRVGAEGWELAGTDGALFCFKRPML